MTSPAKKSLYERLGGYDAVAAFVDDLLPRLTSDPQIGDYWKGHCKDSMKTHRQLIVDFLGEGLGGPVAYRGRDMKTSHDGLNISERDWKIFVKHTLATLDSLEVYGEDREDCLTFVADFEIDIVERA